MSTQTKDVLLSPQYTEELKKEIERRELMQKAVEKQGLRFKRSAYDSLADWLHSEDLGFQFPRIYAMILLKKCTEFSARERAFIEDLGNTVLKITARNYETT